METFPPPHPAVDLATPFYYQLVHSLSGLLPPPLDDTPESLRTRNRAAIAKVAALLPVNADEADLAAQCIAARGQAEDVLRLLRQHAGDIALVIRLNAQYGSMVRTSLALHGRLLRVQALRQKRESIDGAASQDAWVLHVAEQSMLAVVDPDAQPLEAKPPGEAPTTSPREAPTMSPGEARATSPGEAPTTSPEEARAMSPGEARAKWPGAAPAAEVDQTTREDVSEDELNSQDAAFETWLSAALPGRGPGRSDGTQLYEAVRAAMTEPRSTGQELLPSCTPAGG